MGDQATKPPARIIVEFADECRITLPLRRVWVLLPAILKTVEDLSAYLVEKYIEGVLGSSAHVQILLEIGGIPIAPKEDIAIIRDADVVRVTVNHLRTPYLGLEGPAEPLRITGPNAAGEAVSGQGGSGEEEARGRSGKGQVVNGLDEVAERKRKKRKKQDETENAEGARLGATGGVVERASGENLKRKKKRKGRKDEEQGIEDRELLGGEKKTERAKEGEGTGLKGKITENQDGSGEGFVRKKGKKRLADEVAISQGEEQLGFEKKKKKRRRKEGDEVVKDEEALGGQLQLGWIEEAAPGTEVLREGLGGVVGEGLGGVLGEGLGGVLVEAQEMKDQMEVDTEVGLFSKSEALGDKVAVAPGVSLTEEKGDTEAAQEGSTSESEESKSEEETVKKEKKTPSRSARRKAAKRRYARLAREAAAAGEGEAPAANWRAPRASAAGVEAPAKEAVPPKANGFAAAAESGGPVISKHMHFGDSDAEDGRQRMEAAHHQPIVLNVGLGASGQFLSKERGKEWGMHKERKQDKHRAPRGAQNGTTEFRSPERNAAEVGFERRGTPEEQKEGDRKMTEQEYEALPDLEQAPQVADVLAYRLVELTSSWTPQMSEYREGRVASFDAALGMISLAWWPVNDLPARKEAAAQAAGKAEDGVLQEEPAFAHPYDEDGNLEIDLASLVGVKLVQASERTLAQLPNAPPVSAITPTSVASEGSPSSVLAMGDSKSDSIRMEKRDMADAEKEPVKVLELDAANVRPKDGNEVREGPIEAGGKHKTSKEMTNGLGGKEKVAQEKEATQEVAASGACGPEILLGGGMEKGSENEGQDGKLHKGREVGMIENGAGVQAKVEMKKVPAQSGAGEPGREELVWTGNGQIRSDAGFVGSATALGPPKSSDSRTLNPKTPPAWQQWENVANLLSKRRAEIAQQAAAKKQEELDKLRESAQEEGAEGNEGEVKGRGASVGVGHVAEAGQPRGEMENGAGHEGAAEEAGGERPSLERKLEGKKVERSAPGGLDGVGGKVGTGTGADSTPLAEAPGSTKFPVECVKNNGPPLERATVDSVTLNGPSLQEANEGKSNGGHSAAELAHSTASQSPSLSIPMPGADLAESPSTCRQYVTVPPMREGSSGGGTEGRDSPGLSSEKPRPWNGLGASGVGVRGAVKPRAPRLGALGPTLAYLRAQQNQLG